MNAKPNTLLRVKYFGLLVVLAAAGTAHCSSSDTKVVPGAAGESGAGDGGAEDAGAAGEAPSGAGSAGTPSVAGAGGVTLGEGGNAGEGGESGSTFAEHVVGRGAVQIAVGFAHVCVLLDTGAVRCWGSGANGQLGYANGNNIGDDETPAGLGDVDVGGQVKQIEAKRATCALLTTGSVRCWGYGQDGTLGYVNKIDIGDDETPASAGDIDVGGKVSSISMASIHTCAVMSTGALRCWGSADNGVLGYANKNWIGDDETPASAGDIDVGGKVVQVSAALFRTCTLLTTGKVRCWGGNQAGYLGLANKNPSQLGPVIGDDETPASVSEVDVGGNATQLVTGYAHSCALLTSGGVRCWGSGANLGYGLGSTDTIGDDETPASAGDVPIGGTVAQLAAGEDHTCALLTTGAVRCWGLGGAGQLGYGNTKTVGYVDTAATAGNVDVGGKVIQIAAAGQTTCALLDTSAVRCWGGNANGQLGYGNATNVGDDETPASAGDVQY